MKKLKRVSKFVFIFILLLLTFINILLFFEIDWIIKNVGVVSFDEIIFHLKTPLKGTSTDMINDNLFKCLLPTIIIYVLFILLLFFKKSFYTIININIFNKYKLIRLKKLVMFLLLIINLIILFLHFKSFDDKFKIIDYIKMQSQSSLFIEENYVDPRDVKLTFPDKKRNLIYIYLESIESNYMDKENGGNLDNNIIPELTELAKDNINFSDTESLGGAYPMTGTGWTAGAMVSHSSGIPLKIPINGNAYTGYGKFLPGIYNIGDILSDNGYNQEIVFGSDSNFGGRKTYFETHGNTIIKDLYTAREEGIIPEDYYNYWGFEDSILFEYSKKELEELSKKEEPFSFNILTVNTHFPDGYTEDSCTKEYDNDYMNAIKCSSKQVMEFVDWIKAQDFYDNTTVVVVGDHLTMSQNEIVSGISYYNRRIYNAFINSPIDTSYNKNRKFCSLDFFPTTLASLGVSIEGNKLGLGTNLFSDEKTLIEEYDFTYVNNELSKKSNYYDNNFLYK